MRKRRNDVSLGDAIAAFLAEAKLKPGMDEARIRADWEKWMGKTVARYTTEISLSKGRLYIRVSASALKQELFYLREQIATRINNECGEVIVKEVIVL